MRGPASVMILARGSTAAMQPPLHVFPDEVLHQLCAMRFDVSPKSLQNELVEVAEPAGVHQRPHLTEKTKRDFRRYRGGWGFCTHRVSLPRFVRESSSLAGSGTQRLAVT